MQLQGKMSWIINKTLINNFLNILTKKLVIEIPEVKNRHLGLMLQKTTYYYRWFSWQWAYFGCNISRHMLYIKPHVRSNWYTIIHAPLVSIKNFRKSVLLCPCEIVKSKNSSILRWQRFLLSVGVIMKHSVKKIKSVPAWKIKRITIIPTLGSHDDVLKDLSPLYLAKRFLAGTPIGVSTSSGNSENHIVDT